jgi:amidase
MRHPRGPAPLVSRFPFTLFGAKLHREIRAAVHSEPLLISLAAKLEAINGWADKQPGVWWNTPTVKD